MQSTQLRIGIISDYKPLDSHYFHVVGDKYVRAVTEVMGGTPVIVPTLGSEVQIEEYLALVDGLLLSGAQSNIEPHHYRGEASEAGTLHDPARDTTTLSMIPRAIEADIPIFGICRGFQEINVTHGGSLHQKVQDLSEMLDHQEDHSQSLEVQYGEAHSIELAPGGLLASLTRHDSEMVNSVHQQGIRELGQGLAVEATAPDGLIEAYRLAREDRFVYAVQWHPEWEATKNPLSVILFGAFRDACLARQQNKAWNHVEQKNY